MLLNNEQLSFSLFIYYASRICKDGGLTDFLCALEALLFLIALMVLSCYMLGLASSFSSQQESAPITQLPTKIINYDFIQNLTSIITESLMITNSSSFGTSLSFLFK